MRRQIGVVFQETTLDLDLTAEENLRFCTRLYGLSRRESAARIDEALELFGLPTAGARACARSRAACAARSTSRAGSSTGPRSCSSTSRRSGSTRPSGAGSGVPRALCAEHGTTLFLTTHYLEEADPCDRVAIVDRGGIVALGRARRR